MTVRCKAILSIMLFGLLATLGTALAEGSNSDTQQFVEADSIDIDGDGEFDALTDGLLLLRSMFELTDSALISNVIGSNAVYSGAEEIEYRISSISTDLDIDNDGRVDALTDGLLILRYLFGLNGEPLVSDVISINAQRTLSDEIELYLDNLATHNITFTSSKSFSVPENQKQIGKVSAVDADGGFVSYSLAGADAAFLTINSINGDLFFNQPPDYELKSSYEVVATVTDGTDSNIQAIRVSVTDVDDVAPSFTSGSAFAVPENQKGIGSVTVNDVDSQSTFYSITGSDITVSTDGVLSFVTTPDFEQKSSYNATITASDGINQSEQVISITITNVNDVAPVITSSVSFTAIVTPDVEATIGVVTATDADSESLSFTINSAELLISDSGVLSFSSEPDQDGDKTYSGIVSVTDGTFVATQTITVSAEYDTDGDGSADNRDPDDDNDGVPDNADDFPKDPLESVDTDGDGVGNNADTDDDNDGVLDVADEFPLDAGNVIDSDGDGVVDREDVAPNDPSVTKAIQFNLNNSSSIGLGEVLRQDSSGISSFAISQSGQPQKISLDSLTNVINWDADGEEIRDAIMSSETLFVAGANITPDGKFLYLLTSQHIQGRVPGLDNEICSIYRISIEDNTYGCLLNVDDGDIEPKVLVSSLQFDFARRGISFRSDGAAVMQGFDSNRELPDGYNGGTNSTIAYFMTAEGELTRLPAGEDFYVVGVSWLSDAYIAVAEYPMTSSSGENPRSGEERLVIIDSVTLQPIKYVIAPNISGPIVRVNNNIYWMYGGALNGETLEITDSIFGGSGYPVADVDGINFYTFLDTNDENNKLINVNGTPELNLSDGVGTTYNPRKQSGTGSDIKYSAFAFAEDFVGFMKSYGPETPIISIENQEFKGEKTFNLPDGSGTLEVGSTKDLFYIRPTANDEGTQGTNSNNAFIQDSHSSLDETDYYVISPSAGQSVTLRIYDIDDEMKIVLKNPSGVSQQELVYGKGSDITLDVLEYITVDGSTIDLELTNSSAGYTMGWELSVAEEVVYSNSCGQFDVSGCAGDSYSSGIVYEATIQLGSADQIGDLVINYVVSTSGEDESKQLVISESTISKWRADEDRGVDFLEWPSPEPDQEGFCVYQKSQDLERCHSFDNYKVLSFDLESNRGTRYDDEAVYPNGSGNAFPGIQSILFTGDDLRVYFKDTTDHAYYEASAKATDFITKGGSVLQYTGAENGAGDLNIISQGLSLSPLNPLPMSITVAETAPQEITLEFPQGLSDFAPLPRFEVWNGIQSIPLAEEVDWNLEKTIAKVTTTVQGWTGGVQNDVRLLDFVFLPNSVQRYEPSSDLVFTSSNLNENSPVFESPEGFSIPENQLIVGDVIATDEDGDLVGYLISGPDADNLSIDVSTGTLSFNEAPDYEVRTSYRIIVTATDGVNSAEQDISVLVTDVDDVAPVITSPAGFSAPENQTSIGVVTATDVDSDSTSFTVDGDELAITAEGILSFITAPDYETKDVYSGVITATDGTNSATMDITIAVEDVDDPPIITSGTAFTAPENQKVVGTVTATDVDSDVLVFSLESDQLSITSDGVLAFVDVPDYEVKTSYTTTVSVTDGINIASQDITVDIINLNDNSPVISSENEFDVLENQTSIGTVTATDADGDSLTYSIQGIQGTNSNNAFIQDSHSSLDETDYYVISPSAGQSVTLRIYDIDDEMKIVLKNPSGVSQQELIYGMGSDITLNVLEYITADGSTIDLELTNSSAGYTMGWELSVAGEVVYSNSCGQFNVSGCAENSYSSGIVYEATIQLGIANDNVSINTSTGQLTFDTAPDFETKDSYEVIVSASDGVNSTDQTIKINIIDVVDEPPVFVSEPIFSAEENQTQIGVVSVTDENSSEITLSISGSDILIASDGSLSFNEPPDYENKQSYSATIKASDGTNESTQDITVNIINLNDNSPVISSEEFDVLENQTSIGTVIATDADGDSLTYSIQDIEGTQGTNSNNAFIQDSHSSLDETDYYVISPSAGQSVTLRIYDIDDEMKIVLKNSSGVSQQELVYGKGSDITLDVLEYITADGSTIDLELTNSSAGYTMGWELSVAGEVVYSNSCGQFDVSGCAGDSYSSGIVYEATIQLGIANDNVSINTSTGQLTFDTAPDFETKDSYEVIVSASDGVNSTDQTIKINIIDVVD